MANELKAPPPRKTKSDRQWKLENWIENENWELNAEREKQNKKSWKYI